MMERTDFTLVFDGVEVACHKHILSTASPVFEAMVENQHLEAIESKASIQLSEEVDEPSFGSSTLESLRETFSKIRPQLSLNLATSMMCKS